MKKTSDIKEQLLLHLIILIWGFTGILGKVIELPSTDIVWYRMLIAFLGIFIWLKVIKFDIRVSTKTLLLYLGIGLIVALHWVTFFYAIKVSTVSVALATLASATLFTSFLEPLFFKKRIVFYEVIFGFCVIAGLLMIFNFETEYALGILVALLSAFLASLFTVINGKLVNKGAKPRVMTLYEMLGGFIGISIYYSVAGDFTILEGFPAPKDIFYLLLLGLVCTAFAFLISIDVMRVLSPFTVSISINMEPVYSIILALLIFGDDEKMSLGFYAGALLIMATILINAVLKRYMKKRKERGKAASHKHQKL